MVIIGRPNDGKSSIFANFLGDDSVAVSPIPGETKKLEARKINLGERNVELIDTPGLQHPEKVYLKFKEYALAGKSPVESFCEEFTDSKYAHDIEIMKALIGADICILTANADNFFGHTSRCLLDSFLHLKNSCILLGVLNRKDNFFVNDWRAEFESRKIPCFDFDAFKSGFKDCARLLEEIATSEHLRLTPEICQVLKELKDNRFHLWENNLDNASLEILNSLKELMCLESELVQNSFSLTSDERALLITQEVKNIHEHEKFFRKNLLESFSYSSIKINAADREILQSELSIIEPNWFRRILGELPLVSRGRAKCKVNYNGTLPIKFVKNAILFVQKLLACTYAQSATREFEISLSKDDFSLYGIDSLLVENFAYKAFKKDESESFYKLQTTLRKQIYNSLYRELSK